MSGQISLCWSLWQSSELASKVQVLRKLVKSRPASNLNCKFNLGPTSSWPLDLEWEGVVVALPLLLALLLFSSSGLERVVEKNKKKKVFFIKWMLWSPVAINAPLGGNNLCTCCLFWGNISEFCKRPLGWHLYFEVLCWRDVLFWSRLKSSQLPHPVETL